MIWNISHLFDIESKTQTFVDVDDHHHRDHDTNKTTNDDSTTLLILILLWRGHRFLVFLFRYYQYQHQNDDRFFLDLYCIVGGNVCWGYYKWSSWCPTTTTIMMISAGRSNVVTVTINTVVGGHILRWLVLPSVRWVLTWLSFKGTKTNLKGKQITGACRKTPYLIKCKS